MSELFLDTDLDDASIQRITTELSKLGFAPQDLDKIFHDEVAPVCLPNLYSVAGIWNSFDPDWLVCKIENHRRSSYLFGRCRSHFRAGVLRRMVPVWAVILADLNRA